jgi:hypothetical protein
VLEDGIAHAFDLLVMPATWLGSGVDGTVHFARKRYHKCKRLHTVLLVSTLALSLISFVGAPRSMI